MSRRKRQKSGMINNENEKNFDSAEPKNNDMEQLIIPQESERIQRAEWIHEQVKLQREAEDEARVPFADHRIIEYVFNVPWHMKYQNGVEKTLLRDAFSDVLPPELLHRKKSPYPKTYHPGYEALLIKGMEEILDSPNAPVRTLIDTDKTREFLKAPAEYGSPWFGQLMAGPQLIAYFIQINYWMEKYQLSA